MDKEELKYSIKANKKNSNKKQIKNQKNYLNETEEKFVITTKNELITNDNNDNLQSLTNSYKNLDVLFFNRLQSLGNKKENKQSSSNLIKKQNNFNINNLIKQKNNYQKQPVFKLVLNKNNTGKSNETSNQSVSLLLNKDTNNSREQNSINNLNENKKKDSSSKYNIKIVNSSKNIRKKTISNSSSNSPYCSNSSKKMNYHILFYHENSNKIMNNRISYFQKTEGILKKNDLLNENYFRNKQKRITNKRESIENKFKNRLSEESYNNNLKITRTTRSLKTPKILKKNSPQIKKRKKKINSYPSSNISDNKKFKF